jgi:hypothetical protein
MAEQQQPKDAKDESFFRKVVRFVANPATDWADLNSRQDDGGELDLEKSELKAMIERKRRNDFVRKREFDMLRKMRREGLSPEQLAALGHSSRIDDSEVRMTDSPARTPDTGVKAKIDEIEQQMVGEGGLATGQRRTPEFYNAPTQPAALARDRRTLHLRAERPVLAGPRQSYELWLIPAEGGAPISLAVLGQLDARIELPAARVDHVRSGAKLAVSVEPAGGSPTGAPTGPVILIGEVRA